jgi:P-type conjugative transfer protein TrbJ
MGGSLEGRTKEGGCRMKERVIFFFVVLAFLSIPAYSALPVIDFAAGLQLANQLAQLQKQTLYVEQSLQALKGLNVGQYQWSNARALINQLGEVTTRTNALSYSASNLDERFRQAYPGYVAPEDFQKQYKENADRTQATLNNSLQSMGVSAADFQQENQRLAFLQQQAQSAKGQTQAIQAFSQIASELVSQLQLLRQTMMAESNAEVSYYAMQVQVEASARAELGNIIKAGSTKVKPYGSSGHYLYPPHG